jgi:hypothetical protein
VGIFRGLDVDHATRLERDVDATGCDADHIADVAVEDDGRCMMYRSRPFARGRRVDY